MKGYKVGQSYYWPDNGTIIVVVGSYREYIDIMVVKTSGVGYYTNHRIGYLRTNIPSPHLYSWEKRDAIYEVIAGGKRVHDKYHHYAVLHPGGKKLVAISAGCRWFWSTAEALLHWKHRERYRSYYDRKDPKYKTRKAIRVRQNDREMDRWSRAFVRKVERVMTKNRK